jgi:hypothetical protein
MPSRSTHENEKFLPGGSAWLRIYHSECQPTYFTRPKACDGALIAR